MNAVLCVCTSPPNYITKSITREREVKLEFNGDCNILRPVLKFSGVYDFALSGINYIHLVELDRWYYITDISAYRNNVYLLYCEVDVLQTYRDAILSSYGIVTNGADSNPYIAGYIDTVDVRKNVRKLTFENHFTPGTFVLVGARGVRRGANS